MPRLRENVERAAALHRQAAAGVAAAERDVSRDPPEDPDAAQRRIIADLAEAAAGLTPGWLGAPLDGAPPPAVPGAAGQRPSHVRIGTARPLDDAEFPVLVPTDGHLVLDAEPGDTRAIGVLRSVLLRLVAAHPAGTVRVRTVDPSGTLFSAFRPLGPAGLMRQPVADAAGLRVLLGDAEQWVRHPNPQYTLLLVIAWLPDSATSWDLDRMVALARSAPGSGLQLIVAGWPATMAEPLPCSTLVSLRRPYPLVADPPGGSFGASGSLDVPVVLDPDPPAALVGSVCERIAAYCESGCPTLLELLPEQLWQESSADGLAAVVGRAGSHLLTLRLSDLTPHWLVGGGPGAGKTAFLINVLYGLCTRYGPDQLALYLLDFKEGGSFAEFAASETEDGSAPGWVPHVRAVGVESDRDYGRAVLRELSAELTRRAERCRQAGVERLADLPRGAGLPRIVLVIDEFQELVRGNDQVARECLGLLEALARRGRSCGVHLILTSRNAREVSALHARRDSTLGQFPVRIALPGGSAVLDPLNEAAERLGLGEAIVNTAGGLGGPVGASRAHERRVEFPDPYADSSVPLALRQRYWEKRPDDRGPSVFHARARLHLPTELPAATVPTAFLGRRIDVPLSLAGFPLEARPGRHLAVLGPSEVGADLLDAAARSLAAQHEPGTVHFVIAGIAASVQSVIGRLVADLTRAGHRVTADRSAQPPDADGYFFGFGLDTAPSGTVEQLAESLREGPRRGVHVFGWWRGLRRFASDTGARSDPNSVTGLVLLNIPAADAAVLLDEPDLSWQPRPNRVLLHDREIDRTEVVIPFLHSGQDVQPGDDEGPAGRREAGGGDRQR